MSIADEVMGKTPDQLSKLTDTAMKAAKGINSGLKAAGTVNGICLLLIKSAEFSEAKVMQAVRSVAYKKTGDVKYSNNNIDIAKLRESGHVYKVEEHILAEAMGAFDKQCKKHGIKYSAMIDTRDEGKPDYKPTYMIFFEGKDDNLIMSALSESYKDYEKQQKVRAAEENSAGKEKGKRSRGREQNRTGDEPQRESVKAKLAFFRDRVTARDAERDEVEKQYHHEHGSR